MAIELNPKRFRIINDYNDEVTQPKPNDYGFEIGLMLVKSICEKTNISYSRKSEGGIFTVTIEF